MEEPRAYPSFGLGVWSGQVPSWSDSTHGREYANLLELVSYAETLGFQSVWLTEHHFASDGYLPSPMPILGALASRTSTILLGTGVILAPFHHPLRLAEEAAVINQLAAGRFRFLGLGAGWRSEEFRSFGISIGHRTGRLIETLEILRRSAEGRFSFNGKHFAFDDVLICPPHPDPPPLLLLGGFSASAKKRAGEIADGFIISPRDSRKAEDLERTVRTVVEGARTAGRDPTTLTWVFLQNVFITNKMLTPTDRRPLDYLVGVYEAWSRGLDTFEAPLRILPVSDKRLGREVVIGDESHIADFLARFLDLNPPGFIHIVVRLHYPGQPIEQAKEQVTLFAEEVVPLVCDRSRRRPV